VTWSTEDGKHEGWVAALFADGAIHGSSRFDGFQASYAADGSEMFFPEDWRPHTAVVGWVGACTCGWRSQPWTRASVRAGEDLAARRAFGDYVWVDGEAVTDFDPATVSGPVLFDVDHKVVAEAVHAEWKRHIEPALLLGEIAELTARRREVDERLAVAVAQARKAKTPWEDIGRAAGITRQSAHERWARIAAAAGGPR
jgi:hypothetical protein